MKTVPASPSRPCAAPSEPVGSRGRSLTLGSHNRLRERGSTRSNTTLAPASRAMHGRYALFHRIGTRRRDARKRRQAPPTKLGGTDGTIARFAAPNRCRSRSLSSGSRFGAGNGARLPLHRRNADCSCVARSVSAHSGIARQQSAQMRRFNSCPASIAELKRHCQLFRPPDIRIPLFIFIKSHILPTQRVIIAIAFFNRILENRENVIDFNFPVNLESPTTAYVSFSSAGYESPFARAKATPEPFPVPRRGDALCHFRFRH